MKKIIYILLIVMIFGCEDQINPDLPEAQRFYVIDAWIDSKPGSQLISITRSQPYFDSSLPSGVEGAIVYILDDEGGRFNFNDVEDGNYIWAELPTDSIGVVGRSYTLFVELSNGISFTSNTTMGRVPPIDSISFRYEQNVFTDEEGVYVGQFWATDPIGPGDTYWIKAFQNGYFLNKPSEINLAYDAAFGAGGGLDGETFIPPIREGVNSFDEDVEESDGEERGITAFYENGDLLTVEIHSISLEAFNFLNQVIIQTDRPGGFAELFATPLSNTSTNIISPSGEPVQGFFNMAAVSENERRLDVSEVPIEE